MLHEISTPSDAMKAVWAANRIVTEALPSILAGEAGTGEVVARLREMRDGLGPEADPVARDARDALGRMIDMLCDRAIFPETGARAA